MVKALTSELGITLQNDELEHLRDEMRAVKSDQTVRRIQLILANDEVVTLPPATANLIQRTLDALTKHGAVSIGTLPEELTSTTAADILGISRPTLLKLAREGEIDSHKVGSHTRFKREHVLALAQQRRNEQLAALDDLRETIAALEDYED